MAGDARAQARADGLLAGQRRASAGHEKAAAEFIAMGKLVHRRREAAARRLQRAYRAHLVARYRREWLRHRAAVLLQARAKLALMRPGAAHPNSEEAPRFNSTQLESTQLASTRPKL